MPNRANPPSAIERAILEQIAFLHEYLEQLRADHQFAEDDTAGDPFQAAHRDPGFQRWQLQKRLELPL
jgi:hypothetical protein